MKTRVVTKEIKFHSVQREDSVSNEEMIDMVLRAVREGVVEIGPNAYAVYEEGYWDEDFETETRAYLTLNKGMLEVRHT